MVRNQFEYRPGLLVVTNESSDGNLGSLLQIACAGELSRHVGTRNTACPRDGSDCDASHVQS